MGEQNKRNKLKVCKYCGATIRNRGVMCTSCYTKANAVRKFVRVCDKIKTALGYEPKKEVKSDAEIH